MKNFLKKYFIIFPIVGSFLILSSCKTYKMDRKGHNFTYTLKSKKDQMKSKITRSNKKMYATP